MFHTPSGRCLVALCFVLRWNTTAAARPFSTATNLERDEQEIKPVEQEINPSFDVDTYDTCELSEGNYTLSNLSEILCASGKSLKDITALHPDSLVLVLEATKPLRLVGKGWWQTKLDFDISLLPGANLSLKDLHFQGTIAVDTVETSSGQTKMSYLTFVNCMVELPAPDAKQLALAEMERDGLQDPFANAWQGWLMLRDAALTLQIHGSHLNGGAFVEQSTNFSLLASNSSFDLQGQGFQLVNVTSHIQLEEVEVNDDSRWNLTSHIQLEEVEVHADSRWNLGHPSFQMLSGRPEVHVAGSTFHGSAIEIKRSVNLILDVRHTKFKYGRSAIVVTRSEGQVDLQDVKIEGFSKHDSEFGVRIVDSVNASIKDLEISKAKVGIFLAGTGGPSRAKGVSISDCSVAVACNHCDSLSFDDVLIAGNDQAFSEKDDTDLQTSSGLVFFNSWRDTLAINEVKEASAASVLVWSKLPRLTIAFSWVACGLGTILSRIALEQHFSGHFETSWYGQTQKYVPAAASLLLWIMVVEAAVAAFLLRTMRWTYAHQEEVHLKIVKPYATIWLTSLLALLTAAIIYLYITVVRRRLDIKTLADLKRTEMLLQQKDGLKASLDNVELREEMDRIQMQMFLAKTTGDQAKVQETFDEMKSKAEEEASRLADWYAEHRAWYASEDAGARLKALEGIPSQTLAEAVQLPLPTTDESESLDMLCATASWLRSNFKDHLMKVCSDLNGINSRADLQNLGYDEMQFDPATHPLQPEANASIGQHVGLLVAPVKSKDRAQAKVMTDYKEDQAAGKKSELPLARYVCDFLRATIFASDPYVLAVAFWQLQKEFEFVRVKNKFGEEGLRPELRTNILVNLWVKHGDCALIGEVQFLLQDYLTAKSLQHLYYDVARAASPEELWGKPIFR